jgi:IS5 family transposase
VDFTGEEFFQHEFPHERSDLTYWRKRLGSKLETLLAESLRGRMPPTRWAPAT